MMEPEVFSPAELGMEGAKLAAIRRRRHGCVFSMICQQNHASVLSWIKVGCRQNGKKQIGYSMLILIL